MTTTGVLCPCAASECVPATRTPWNPWLDNRLSACAAVKPLLRNAACEGREGCDRRPGATWLDKPSRCVWLARNGPVVGHSPTAGRGPGPQTLRRTGCRQDASRGGYRTGWSPAEMLQRETGPGTPADGVSERAMNDTSWQGPARFTRCSDCALPHASLATELRLKRLPSLRPQDSPRQYRRPPPPPPPPKSLRGGPTARGHPFRRPSRPPSDPAPRS